MNERYPYADLAQINRWVGWLLLPPAIMTGIALLHAFYSHALLTGLPGDLALAHLPPLPARTLRRAGALRQAQLGLTGLFILFFCVCWLFLAFRNLNALSGDKRSLRNTLVIHLRIWASLLFALLLMRGLWRESTPDSHADRAQRWLVPWWWTVLVAAHLGMAMALLALREPVLVGDWRLGNYWIQAAYVGYLTLFLLTWRLVKRLEVLQRASWRHRSANAGSPA